MLSRIADSMFWLNRYMERADGLLRTIRTHYILMLDKSINQTLSWKQVLDIYSFLPEEEKIAMENNSEAVLKYLLFNSQKLKLETSVEVDIIKKKLKEYLLMSRCIDRSFFFVPPFFLGYESPSLHHSVNFLISRLAVAFDRVGFKVCWG